MAVIEEIQVLVEEEIEPVNILIEEEIEPINILVEEIGHGVDASIFDHRDVEQVGSLQNSHALMYDSIRQKFINKLILGILEYDDDYKCFIVP